VLPPLVELELLLLELVELELLLLLALRALPLLAHVAFSSVATTIELATFCLFRLPVEAEAEADDRFDVDAPLGEQWEGASSPLPFFSVGTNFPLKRPKSHTRPFACCLNLSQCLSPHSRTT
jgi:hypothetical protein